MKSSRIAAKVLFAGLFVMLALSPAVAQDGAVAQGDLGFSFYTGLPMVGDYWFPGGEETIGRYYGIGAVYQALPYLRIAPGFIFMKQEDRDKNKLTDTETRDSDVYIGGSVAVFYTHDIAGGLSLYAGPRFEILRQESDDEFASGGKSEDKQMNTGIVAVFGLQHVVANRLVVFADMGFGYYSFLEESTSYDAAGVKTSDYEEGRNKWALSRSTIGVIFYLMKG